MGKALKFPANFLWGGAISAEQSEGYKGTKADSIYKLQFDQAPHQFIDQIGPEITSNVFEKYHEDVQLYQSLNFNSFRTSFAWGRLFPQGMDHPPSPTAIAFYHRYIDACHKANIEFMGTLFHFDLPAFAWKKGGWESPQVIEDFVKYCDFVFQEFGHKIKRIVTFCEPIIPALNGYLNGRHFPNIKSMPRAINVAFGVILAHAKVVNLFNQKYHDQDHQIGALFDAKKAYPQSQSPSDLTAAKYANMFLYTGMIDAMILGKFDHDLITFMKQNNFVPALATKANLDIIKKTTIDFYGINYYAPLRVKHTDEQNEFLGLFAKFVPPDARMNVFRGIEIYPEGLYDLMIDMNKRYQLPFLISENGMGVENEHLFRRNGQISDDYRIAFMQEHLEQIHKAIAAGANVFGYNVWAAIDNWSWINAYKNRYGLIEIDLETQARIVKKSGLWFKDLIINNGFTTPYQKVEQTIDMVNLKYRKNN